MIFVLKTLSHVLTGSGEAGGLIDTDVVFDNVGIPYIPARRMKGLLKESCMEVCDMLGYISYDLVFGIFGKDGGVEAKISISNLYIDNYEQIVEDINFLLNQGLYKDVLQREKVISNFCEIRHHTAVDEITGTAKKGTLRTYRMLKPGIIFKGKISELELLTEKEKALLCLAAMNLRRVGLARNRGYGRVQCGICCDLDYGKNEKKDVKKMLDILRGEEGKLKERKEERIDFGLLDGGKGELKRLTYEIVLKAPLVIAEQVGEQNTVYTKKYIPSTVIRGLIAREFEKKAAANDVLYEKFFQDIFVNNLVRICPAYPVSGGRKFLPLPMFLQKNKKNNDNKLYCVLNGQNRDLKTKAARDFIYFGENQLVELFVPETEFYFHNTRDRAKGRNTEEGIFYYEAIAQEQRFRGEIIGSAEYLSFMKKLLREDEDYFIGRSKTAQYGRINWKWGELEGLEDRALCFGEQVDGVSYIVITAVSPIILFNEFGNPEVSSDIMEAYLKRILGTELKIVEQFCSAERVESFMRVWNLKTATELAYSPGASFLVEIPSLDEKVKERLKNLLIEGIGEKTEWGFGCVNVYPLCELNDIYEVRSPDRKNRKSGEAGNHVKDIIIEIVKRDFLSSVRYLGFENAREWNEDNKIPISNSFLGKIEYMFLKTSSAEEFKKLLEEIKDKKIGENISKYEVFSSLRGEPKKYITENLLQRNLLIRDQNVRQLLEDILQKDEAWAWTVFAEYWLAFLRTLRLLSKGTN